MPHNLSFHVLIVEDDPAILRGLKDSFENYGHSVTTIADGESAIDIALTQKFDLILLDVMLPRANGYEILKFLRSSKITTPILMLTAKDEEEDLIRGLQLGADDYMTKPFSIRELLARCQALIRRHRSHLPTTLKFGNFTLDISSRTLLHEDSPIKLSPKEFDLLRFFLENKGRALSRDTILNEVWGHHSDVTPRSIDRFVTTLRNKIEPNPHTPTYIHTIREVGYSFTP